MIKPLTHQYLISIGTLLLLSGCAMDKVNLKKQPDFSNLASKQIIVYTRGLYTNRSLDTNLNAQDIDNIKNLLTLYRQDRSTTAIENVSIIAPNSSNKLASEFCDSIKWMQKLVKQDSLIVFVLDGSSFIKNGISQKLNTRFITYRTLADSGCTLTFR